MNQGFLTNRRLQMTCLNFLVLVYGVGAEGIQLRNNPHISKKTQDMSRSPNTFQDVMHDYRS